MCGILGRINFDKSKVDQSALVDAAASLKHRGPDGVGYWNNEGCGMGHTRLSIHDLTDAGCQPMESLDGRYVCVFNGEIYNFRELRKSLSDDVYQWKGDSDTEVLLQGWVKWGGIKLLDKIEGMFAFVIWDRHKRKVFAARDRMGEKPFFYHSGINQFGFSSRLSQLFTLFPDLSHEYDEQAIRLYLECGYIPAPNSIYGEIKKIPAAHYLISDESGIEIIRYWDFCNIEPDQSLKSCKEDVLLDELDDLLTNSVKLRMDSDVPLGAFLSGGIDSSLLTALMNKNSINPVKTFTIGFNVEKYDESMHAESVSNFLKTDHYCENLHVNQLLDLMPNFFKNYDEPFFDSAAFPTMAVSRLAKKHVSVCMTGDGGDEIFGGYHYYDIAKTVAPFFSMPDWIRRIMSGAVGLSHNHNLKLLSSMLKESNSARAFAFSRSISKDFKSLVSTNILNNTKGIQDIFEYSASKFPKNIDAGERGMRLDMMYTLSDDYLQKTDIASMAFSLETRAPILSREIVEWGMRLPINWKLRGRTSKYLLRKLAYRYIPSSIIDRPKQGFGVPIDSWLRNELSDFAEERVYNPQYYIGLPVNQKAVIDLYKLHKSGERNSHPLLWAVIMLLEFNSLNK